MKKVRRFDGTEGSYIEGTATSLRDDTEDQLRQDQMERAARLANDANAIGTTSPKFKDMDEFMASQRAAAEQQGENILKGMRDAEAKPKDFKSAFAGARSAGDKTFEFNGKKYTTDLAKPTAPAAATTAMPSNANVAPATPMSKDPSQRTKLKYQSLQDRAEEYAMKNKAAGMGMYGTKKSEPATGNPKRSKNISDMLGLSSNYASGGKVRSASSRADGIAIRGKTRA
jgi:hypothetical protein